MDAREVAEYLKHNPRFFEDHVDVLAGISLPHPHAGHAIPIAERQVITLRERVAELEARMRELIRFGGENDAIGTKLHRSTLALFGASDLPTTLAVLYQGLQEDFAVPRVAMCLWDNLPVHESCPELQGTSEELRAYADQLRAPCCSDVAPFETRDWFGPPNGMRSYAFLPLRTSQTFGLVGLASDDPQRFIPGIGTIYLTRLSELASVATARYLSSDA